MELTGVNPDGTFRNRTDQLARRIYHQEQQPAIGGALNPQFVEWLMGWPMNWTSMDPLPPDTLDAWRLAFLRESKN